MIVRVAKVRNYSVISNPPIVDKNLTWQATGLLAWLLTKPNNWEINVEHLIDSKKNGRESVYSILRELIAANYVVRTVEYKREGGKITGSKTTYLVMEEASLNTAFWDSSNCDPRKPNAIVSTESIINTELYPHSEIPHSDMQECEEQHSDSTNGIETTTPPLGEAPPEISPQVDGGADIKTGCPEMALNSTETRHNASGIHSTTPGTPNAHRGSPQEVAKPVNKKVNKLSTKLSAEQTIAWKYACDVFALGYLRMTGLSLDFKVNGKALSDIGVKFAEKKELFDRASKIFYNKCFRKEKGYEQCTFSPKQFLYKLDSIMAEAGGMTKEDKDIMEYGTIDQKRELLERKGKLNS